MHTNNELSATSILSLFDTTKAERTSFVRSVINSLKDGIADPLKVHLQLKNTEALIEELSKDVEYKEMLQTEATKHGKKFDLHNAGFQIKETGVKYNYDKLVIKEQNRPQKVAVQLDAKTSVMVYPEMAEHARERYRQRHKQSQEQANTKQRASPNKGKKKEPQSDLIFFH